MPGKFYAVGLGPAQKDLIVPRATKALNDSDVIFLMTRPDSRTHQLVAGLIGDKKIEFYAPKTFGWGEWGNDPAHEEAANRIQAYLNRDQQVSLIIFGDPALYSPLGYIAPYLRRAGTDINIIPGVAYYSMGGFAALIRDDENLLLAGAQNLDQLSKALDIANTICAYAVRGEDLERLRNFAREKNLIIARQIRVGAEGEIDHVLDLLTDDGKSNGGIVVLKKAPAGNGKKRGGFLSRLLKR